MEIWIENFENYKKAKEIALKWNKEIKKGKKTEKGHYEVRDAPEKDKKLPINQDCPDMKAVYFIPEVVSTVVSKGNRSYEFRKKEGRWFIEKVWVDEEKIPKMCQNCFYLNEFPNCPKFCPQDLFDFCENLQDQCMEYGCFECPLFNYIKVELLD